VQGYGTAVSRGTKKVKKQFIYDIASGLQSRCCGSDCWRLYCSVPTLGKLFTRLRICHQAV